MLAYINPEMNCDRIGITKYSKIGKALFDFKRDFNRIHMYLLYTVYLKELCIKST